MPIRGATIITAVSRKSMRHDSPMHRMQCQTFAMRDENGTGLAEINCI
jgi:hypothetical protein